MKRGVVDRDEDVSGMTGTGLVAEFAISSDGRTVIFWPVGVGHFPSLQDAINTHGHDGKTRFVILDDPEVEVEHCTTCHIKGYGHACAQHIACPGCLETVDGGRARVSVSINGSS